MKNKALFSLDIPPDIAKHLMFLTRGEGLCIASNKGTQ